MENLAESNFDVMFGFHKEGVPMTIPESYGSFVAYSGEDEVELVQCDIGGIHFSSTEV